MGLLGFVQTYWAYLVIVYVAYVVLYRLFVHPLKDFPGPKLAAVTRCYEAYFDVVCNGQYTFKIAQLHEQYGPIIRISPHELHINDPSYFQVLYSNEGQWNKYDWACDAFGVPNSTICSVDHDDHQMRRASIGGFFSKANVSRRQRVIKRLTAKLCSRLRLVVGSGTTINVSFAISAFTRDVATEFLLSRTYSNLDAEDFHADMAAVFQSSGTIWRITKHLRWLGPFMNLLPMSSIVKFANPGTKAFFEYTKDILNIVHDTLVAPTRSQDHVQNSGGFLPWADAFWIDRPVMKSHPITPDYAEGTKETLLHDILHSDLPGFEKTTARLNEECSTITGAAFEPSANTMRLILYYIYTNPRILNQLRAEIGALKRSSGVDEVTNLRLSALEQLPYLTSVIMEGLRLTPGLATRMARIAPDRVLRYRNWQIPPGTPVGMTTLLMHTDPAIYCNPKRFNPDRWMDIRARKTCAKTYAPFSKGSRICLGMHLAWAQMYTVVAALVDEFDLEFDGAGPKDVECVSDQFTIGVADSSGIRAWVSDVKV